MKDSRIYLRAFELDDYKTSVTWRNDSHIWNMLGGTKYFVSEAYEKKWVEEAIFNSKDIRLAVCLKENDLYIGNVYLTDIDMINRKAVSHVLIGNKDYWGKGYASEALKLLLDYAFNERGLNRIVADILESNEQSIRMHEKTGYKKEGLMRESVFKNGKFQNQIRMSLLKEDFYNTENTNGGGTVV